MSGASFDQGAFADAVAAVIQARGLTDQQTAHETGLDPSTITRVIRQGKNPNVHSLAALTDWADLPIDTYFTRTHRIAAPPDDVIRHTITALRASRTATDALTLLIAGKSGPPTNIGPPTSEDYR